jgi:flagellar biosynthetic protein FliR
MFQGPELIAVVFQVLWILLRVGTAWIFFPVLSHPNIPATVKTASALAFSVALYPIVKSGLPTWTVNNPPALGVLILEVLREILFGVGMGLAAKWIFTSIVAAAQWAGNQIGFSAGSIIDPESGAQDSAWTEFNGWLGIMVFFAVGGQMWLLEALRDSYTFSLKDIFIRLSDVNMAAQFWVQIGADFFVWMLKLSGPMVAVALLLQVALGVLSKFIPQINVWLVSIPLTIGVGVFVFTLLSPMYGDALEDFMRSFRETQYHWLTFVGVR